MDAIFWGGGLVTGTYIRYIGPYKIAHWLRKHGYQAQVIDFAQYWTEETLYKLTKHFITPTTKVIGISTTFLAARDYTYADGTIHNLPESVVNVVKRIKDEYPNIKFVLGGYKSDLIDGQGIIDATVMSYTTAPDDIFLEYLEHLTNGTPPPLGKLIFPRLNVTTNTPRMLFDTARNPKYNIETDDFKFTKQDCILPQEPLPIDISRGCIFACRFCQYPHLGKGKLDYIRGMEYIEQEMLYNYENFGTQSYYVLDDTFNDTEIKMQAFYDMTQRLPFKISYYSFLRADLIDRFPNTAHLLKESGLSGAYHGVESLHPEASKIVGKAWSGTRGKDFLPKLYHDIWNKEIAQHLNFIVGITKEPPSNIKNTIQWFEDNDMHGIKFACLGLYGKDSKISDFTVLSEFDKNYEKYGYTFTDDQNWKNDFWTTDTAISVARQAQEYLSTRVRYGDWQVPTLEWYGYSRQEIMQRKSAEFDWFGSIYSETREKRTEYYKMLLSL
jgi:radical SAM superfamily enzyme YgiQ (UPF0313 family)